MPLDRGKLFETVFEFRSAIEQCWTEESARTVPEITVYGPGIPGGQCAVTCLVLKDVLKEKFPEYRVRLVGGSLRSSDDRVLIAQHVWLEISDGDVVIIDPTADQSKEIHEPVIAGSLKEIQEKGLSYTATEIENDHGESKHPKRFVRYQVLKRAFAQR
jgi:hypothetical protein